MARSAIAAIPGAMFGLTALATVALFNSVVSWPVQAETPSQLDAESRATDTAAGGIALARQQIRDDELLSAMATLERVMMRAPGNLEARALHAGLLCRIDDRRGAMTEFGTLHGLDVPQPVSAEAREPCRGGR